MQECTNGECGMWNGSFAADAFMHFCIRAFLHSCILAFCVVAPLWRSDSEILRLRLALAERDLSRAEAVLFQV
jgi:hypothetical protein